MNLNRKRQKLLKLKPKEMNCGTAESLACFTGVLEEEERKAGKYLKK